MFVVHCISQVQLPVDVVFGIGVDVLVRVLSVYKSELPNMVFMFSLCLT